MAKKNPEPKPDTGTHTESPKDFVEIGGSPVPGLTLRHVLRGHTDAINRIAWSPDGKYLASPSKDKTIRIWDMSTRECVRVLEGHTGSIWCVAWSPDKYLIASTGENLEFWDVEKQSKLSECNILSTTFTTAWSSNGHVVVSGSTDKNYRAWNFKTKQLVNVLSSGTSNIVCSVWLPDNEIAILGIDRVVSFWNVNSNKITLELRGHSDMITSLALSPDHNNLASSSTDKTIRIWDVNSGRLIRIIEGHNDRVSSVSYLHNGKILASKSNDDTIQLWRTDNWSNLSEFKENSPGNWTPYIAFHPHLPILATLGEKDTIIRIWELDEAVLLGQVKENVNYTTAKLVLVGDSGVGKTGLGWRLAHGEFKEHASTHGQQFWSIPQLNLKRKDGTDCEAVLWDLAGQHVYRQVHSIFLENVAAALVLFDPTNRQEPLKGAQFWLEQLKGKGKLPPTVLVGARVDRGAPALSQDELNQFCQRYGIQGGYISTSALKGDGLDELLDRLKAQIPWDDMTATVTTVTFKRIKDYVLSLKEKTDRKGVLVSPSELRKLLEEDDRQRTIDDGKNTLVNGQSSIVAEWQFTDAEMMTAVGHLETSGIVTILKSSSGETYILLVSDLLISLASSIVLTADRNPKELGSISENELLQGKIPFDELKGLDKHEQQILIDAAILRFLEHNICFRDTFGNDTLLIFPSLIKQKRPLQDNIPATDDISFVVRGRVENLYASLVVLLGYTPSFSRINQWQNQAQYEMDAGQVCGFRSIEEREGELELVLYYGEKMPPKGREQYQELFEQFLYQRDVDVTRFPPVTCKNHHRIERATVVKRVREGKDFVFCDECGDKTFLPDFDQPQTIGIGASPWLQREEAMARLRSSYEKHLTNIKSYRRGWATPRAYLSHLPEQDELGKKLTHDLQDAGVYIIEKPEDLKTDDFAVILDTPAYRKAFQSSSSALANDAKAIRTRLSGGNKKVLSIACEGKHDQHNIKECRSGDFCDTTHYVVGLFNLVMELYVIPLNHKGFEPLRNSLHQQWEQTISHLKQEIFISYAWGGEREEIVDQLDTEFQRRGVTIIRDKRDLGFKGSIKGFMEQIGTGKAVLLVISEKYLKSPNCCFELVQIAKHGQFKDRIFPIVLNDANIYDPVDRLRYVKHWENKKNELDDLIKTVSAANLDGFREDIDLYTEIRALLPRLMDVLKDMNTLTPDLHRQSEFSEIFGAVMAKLEE